MRFWRRNYWRSGGSSRETSIKGLPLLDLAFSRSYLESWLVVFESTLCVSGFFSLRIYLSMDVTLKSF